VLAIIAANFSLVKNAIPIAKLSSWRKPIEDKKNAINELILRDQLL
ncbi:unnamed protein product, partial [Acidithrix sp. C25]